MSAIWSASAAGSAAVRHPPEVMAVAEILGREAEVQAVGRFLDGPAPAALILEGPAGIGKTTVWQVGLEHAHTQSRRVLVTRPSEVETAPATAGLIDLLGDVFDEHGGSLPAPQRAALGVALLREDGAHADAQPGTVSAGALGLLRRASEESPVLLAVDDLQWLDPATAGTLAFALRRLGETPVLLLATTRTEEARADARSRPDRGTSDDHPAARRRVAVPAHRARTRPASPVAGRAADRHDRSRQRLPRHRARPGRVDVRRRPGRALAGGAVPVDAYQAPGRDPRAGPAGADAHGARCRRRARRAAGSRPLAGAVGRGGAGGGVRRRRRRGAGRSRAVHASTAGGGRALQPVSLAAEVHPPRARRPGRHGGATRETPRRRDDGAIRRGRGGDRGRCRRRARARGARRCGPTARGCGAPHAHGRRRCAGAAARERRELPGAGGGHRPSARAVPPRRPRIASGAPTRRGPHLGGHARAHGGEGQRDRAARRTRGVRDRRHDARNVSPLPRARPVDRRRRAVRAAAPAAGGGSLGTRGGRRAEGVRAVPGGFRRRAARPRKRTPRAADRCAAGRSPADSRTVPLS